VDQDNSGTKPAGFPSWRTFYDKWLSEHLIFSEKVADEWIDVTIEDYQNALHDIEGLEQDELLSWTLWINRENPNGKGMLHPNRIKYSSAYPVSRTVRRNEPLDLANREVLEKRKNQAQTGVNNDPSSQGTTNPSSGKKKSNTSILGKSTCPASGCAKCKRGKITTSTHALANTGKSTTNNPKTPGTNPSRQSGLQKRAREVVNRVLEYRTPLKPDLPHARSSPQVSKWWYSEMDYDHGVCRWDIVHDSNNPPENEDWEG